MLKIPAIQKNKERTRQDRRTETGIFQMFLCLLMALALFVFLMSLQRKQLESFEKGSVLTAAQLIPQDTEITEDNYSQYFVTMEIPKENIPAAACMSAEDLIGKYCVADIDTGNMITDSMFTLTCADLSEEYVLVSVNTSNLDQNVAGTLRAGDIIDVYVLKEKENGDYTAMQICNATSVQRSYNSSGTAIMREDTDTVAQVVTIPMKDTDTAYFLEALEKGTVKLIKYVNPQ